MENETNVSIDNTIPSVVDASAVVSPDTSSVIETTESITVEYLDKHYNSIENIMIVELFGSALIAGCLIATLIMRWFSVR